jgi:hypothetical protein
MDKQIWHRFGGACGILFVVLNIVGLSTTGSNRTVGYTVALAGFVLFIPFLGYLYSVLRRAEGEDGWLSMTAFGAGLVGLAIKFGDLPPELSAQRAGFDPGVIRALNAMAATSFILSLLPLGVLVAVVAIVALKSHALPAWIGWLSALTAIALLVDGMFVDSKFGPAFPLFLLWTVLLSAFLTWRAGRASAGKPSVKTSLSPKPVR